MPPMERSSREQAPSVAGERYRLLFDRSPQPMWVYDAETLRFLAVNEAAVDRYGYTRERFASMTVADLRPDADVPILEASVDAGADAALAPPIGRHRKAGGDTVARLGGDGFPCLVEGVDDGASAGRVADRVRRELSQPFEIGGQEVFTSASIGIALGGVGDHRPEDLLRDADTAMYRAKAQG